MSEVDIIMATPPGLSASSGSPAEALIVHTLNVVKTIKPSSHGQVADAIHQTLHYALDGLEQDWQWDPAHPENAANGGCGPFSSTSDSFTARLPDGRECRVRNGFVANPQELSSQARPFISYRYDTTTRSLHVPHPLTIQDPLKSDPCGPENRDAHDVSTKFFFLDDADVGPEAIEETLTQLRANTGLVTVDTLTLAFENISKRWLHRLDDSDIGTLTSAEKLQFEQDVDKVRSVWQQVSLSPFIVGLGLSDLPPAFLETLFAPDGASAVSPAGVPSDYRIPKVIAIRSDKQHSTSRIAEGLTTWAQSWAQTLGEEPQLLSHADPEEILPPGSLPSVLSEFYAVLPHPLTRGNELRAQYCLRYTVLNKDRGLLADRGYIVHAS